jgi:hypothetical protein
MVATSKSRKFSWAVFGMPISPGPASDCGGLYHIGGAVGTANYVSRLQVSSINSKGNLVGQLTLASLAWFEKFRPMQTIGFPVEIGAII